MRLRPLALRATGAGAALLLLLGLLVESGLLRGFLKARLVERLAREGLTARLDSFDVSLLRRQVLLRELGASAADGSWRATARLVRARLKLAALWGSPAVDELEVDGLRLELRAGAQPTSRRSPSAVPRIGRLALRDAVLRYRDEARRLELAASGVSLDGVGTAAGLRGSLRVAGAVRVVAAERILEPRLSDASWSFERGDLRFGPLTLSAPEGRLSVAGVVKNAAADPALELSLYGDLDAARVLTGGPQLRGELKVEARVSGPAAAPTAAFTLRSTRLESGAEAALDLVVRGAASAAGLEVESIGAGYADGALLGRGRFAWSEGPSEAHLEWNGLQLRKLLEAAGTGPRASARLAGRLDAEWPAGRWREARATARVEAKSADATDAPPALDGSANGGLERGGWKLAVERLTGAGLELQGELRGRLGARIAESTLAGSVSLVSADVGRSARALGATATRLAGSATATLQLSGSLASPLAAFRAEALDVAGPLPLAPARITAEGSLSRAAADVSSLALETTGLSCQGSGRVDFASERLSGRLSVKLEDVASLREALPTGLEASGPATATATLGGTWRSPSAALELRAQALRLAGQGFASLEARANAGGDSLAIESLELAPDGGGRIRARGRIAAGPAWQAALEIEAEDADLTSAVRLRSPAVSRAVLSLQATLDGPLAEPARLSADVRLVRLELNGEPGALALERPARLVLRPGEIRVDELRLRAGASVLEASGWLGGPAAEGMRGSLQGRLEDLARWLPESSWRTLRGPIDATFRASGDPKRPRLGAHVEARQIAIGAAGDELSAALSADLSADAPSLDRLTGELAVSGIRLETKGALLEQQGAGRVSIEGGTARLAGFEWHGGGSELKAEGVVRLGAGAPLEAAQLDLRAAGQLDLRLAGALGPGIEGGGVASLDLRVGGSAAAPELRGQVALDGTQLRYRPKRLSLDGLSGRLVLGDGRLELQDVSGSVNGGSFQAKGSLELRGLRPQQGRIELLARGAALDWPRGFTGELDAELALESRDGQATLSGDVTLASGSYDGNPRVLYEEFEAWRAQPSQASALDPLRFELRVHTLDDVHINTIYGRLDLSTDLQLGGRLEAPELLGKIEAAPGAQLFVGGRTYDLEILVLEYTKAGGLLPSVRSRASTRVPADGRNYAITADFLGPLDAPETRLRSDPPLTEREIASLLTTGRTGGGAASPDAVGLLAADLLGGVGRSFGLDTVRLEGAEGGDELLNDPLLVASEADPHSRLTFTKRWRDFEVTLSQELASGGKRTTFISYRPVQGLLARATQYDDQTYGLELRHELALGAVRRAEPARPARPERRGGRVASVELRAEGVVGERELRERLELREGDRFDYQRWLGDRDRLQRALARAGFFEARVFATREPRADRETAPDTPVQLRYRALGGPRTTLVFQGYSAPAELRRQIVRSWSRSEFSSSIEEDAARLTRAFLVDRGFVAAHAEASTAEGQADEPWKRLTVRVEPGARASRREVLFPGGERLPAERLRALVRSDEDRRRAFREPASLARATVTLARGEGFLAAKADASVSLRGDLGVLEVAIDAGRPFSIDEVRVSGATGLSESEVRETAALEPASPFREALTEAARGRLRKLLHSRGFGQASVRIDGTVDLARAQVDVAIQVDAGPRQVLQEIVVDGDERPAGRRLAEKAGLRIGEPVAADDWARVRRRLFESGLYRGVELQVEPIEGAGEVESGETQPVRARVRLEDWPRLRVRYGLQLAGTRDPLDEEGPADYRLGGIAEATRQTLLGLPLGSSLSAQAREGFALGRGVLSLPRTFGAPIRSSVYLTRQFVDRPVAVLGERYTLTEDSTELTFEQRLRAGRVLELAASYATTWTRLHGDLAFVPFDESARIGRLRATALLDGRDRLIDAQRGYFHSTSYERGGGGGFDDEQYSFRRIFLQQFVYVPAWLGTVLATGLRYEQALGRDLLIGGRLAVGGATTVRGYPEDVAAGVVRGESDVTERRLVLNQEVRFPVKGMLFGGAFVDHASLWRTGEGRTLSRTGVGLGLRFRTSVGVLRFDVGYPLQGEDPKLRFYLALGHAY